MSDDNTTLLNILGSHNVDYERTIGCRDELIHVSEPKMTIQCCDTPGLYTIEEKSGYWTLSELESYLLNPKGGPRLLLLTVYKTTAYNPREMSFPILCTDFDFLGSELYQTIKNTALNFRLERTYASPENNPLWSTDGTGPWLITVNDRFCDRRIYNNLQEVVDAIIEKSDLVQCQAAIMRLKTPKNLDQKDGDNTQIETSPKETTTHMTTIEPITSAEEFNHEVDKLRQAIPYREVTVPVNNSGLNSYRVWIDKGILCEVFKDAYRIERYGFDTPVVRGTDYCTLNGVVAAVTEQPAPYVTFLNPTEDGFVVPAGTEGLDDIAKLIKQREDDHGDTLYLFDSYGDPELNGWDNLTLNGEWVVCDAEDNPINSTTYHHYYDALVALCQAFDNLNPNVLADHKPYIRRVKAA